MALIGGGGAGNVAGGANPSGVNSSINYIGNHCYGTSGSIQDSGTDGPNTTLLDFATGNHYIVSTIDFTSDLSSGHNLFFNIIFNGDIVTIAKESTTANQPMRFYVLIPPNTHAQIKWGAGTTANATAFLQGRVY